jgi:hypothetical protein
MQHYIHSAPSIVEGWFDRLPYKKWGTQYHQELCNGIRNLNRSSAIEATWIRSVDPRPCPDMENLLIWNVGSVLKRAATDFLGFESRKTSVPPLPTCVGFDASHYVRYEVISPPDPDLSNKSVLAESAPVRCSASDLSKPASL